MICIDNKPLKGNEVAPPLKLNEEYLIQKVIKCGCGKEHYDVGLKSQYSWISCHTCGEKLPQGDIIHWCCPTRFNK